MASVGKKGRLVEAYLPAILGNLSATRSLMASQVRLLQTLVRETTRAARLKTGAAASAASVERSNDAASSPADVDEPDATEAIVGSEVPDFSCQGMIRCPLLLPEVRYLGFNGNRVRRGGGYRLDTEGGWTTKAGYAPGDAEAFLSDLAVLAKYLGLLVVGLQGPSELWLNLEELISRASTPAGRRTLSKVHVRVYAESDYLSRWNRFFGWLDAAPLEEEVSANEDLLARFSAAMRIAKLPLRSVAADLEVDHSFLSKIINGKKRPPEKIMTRIRDWLRRRTTSGREQRSRRKPRPIPHGDETDSLDVAVAFLDRGWGVVPQRPGVKKPCVKWKEFQDRLPTRKELSQWFTTWPDAGFALILGPISGVFVLDVDGEEAHAALLSKLGSEPEAPKAISGSREPCRYHLYFRHPDLATKAKSTPWHPNLEFRGHRGIVIIPPSQHKSGHCYAWAPGRSPDDLELPELPKQILDSLKPVQRPAPGPRAVAQRKKVDEGLDASPRTMQFLSGEYSEGPGWNKRLFEAACDLCGRGMAIEYAEPLLLEGADPWNAGEKAAARRTIASAFSERREPGRC